MLRVWSERKFKCPGYHSFCIEACLEEKEGYSHNSYSTLKMVSCVTIGQFNSHILKINTSGEQLRKCLCNHSTELVFLCGIA